MKCLSGFVLAAIAVTAAHASKHAANIQNDDGHDGDDDDIVNAEDRIEIPANKDELFVNINKALNITDGDSRLKQVSLLELIGDKPGQIPMKELEEFFDDYDDDKLSDKLDPTQKDDDQYSAKQTSLTPKSSYNKKKEDDFDEDDKVANPKGSTKTDEWSWLYSGKKAPSNSNVAGAAAKTPTSYKDDLDDDDIDYDEDEDVDSDADPYATKDINKSPNQSGDDDMSWLTKSNKTDSVKGGYTGKSNDWSWLNSKSTGATDKIGVDKNPYSKDAGVDKYDDPDDYDDDDLYASKGVTDKKPLKKDDWSWLTPKANYTGSTGKTDSDKYSPSEKTYDDFDDYDDDVDSYADKGVADKGTGKDDWSWLKSKKNNTDVPAKWLHEDKYSKDAGLGDYDDFDSKSDLYSDGAKDNDSSDDYDDVLNSGKLGKGVSSPTGTSYGKDTMSPTTDWSSLGSKNYTSDPLKKDFKGAYEEDDDDDDVDVDGDDDDDDDDEDEDIDDYATKGKPGNDYSAKDDDKSVKGSPSTDYFSKGYGSKDLNSDEDDLYSTKADKSSTSKKTDLYDEPSSALEDDVDPVASKSGKYTTTSNSAMQTEVDDSK